MQLLRLYEDETGESHFDFVKRPMQLLDDSPPATPHYFSDPEPAAAWTCVRCPSDWDGGLHPAPRRQIVVCTGGCLRMTSSLDVSKDLHPGDAILLEDTSGKGHVSEVVSQEAFEAIIIRLE